MISVFGPVFDKMSLTYRMSPPDVEHTKATLTQLCIDYPEFFKIVSYPDSGRLTCDMYLVAKGTDENETRKIKIQITVFFSGNLLRVEFNPSKLDDESRALLNRFFPMFTKFKSFEEFLVNGKITRFDLAYDILGINLRDFVYRAKCMRMYKSVLGHDDKLGSIYMGCSKSNNFLIYDKGKELRQRGEVVPEERVRIEFRHFNPNLYMGDLLYLPCFFERIEIFNTEISVPTEISKECLGLFKIACHQVGIQNAALEAGVPRSRIPILFKGLAKGGLPEWRIALKSWKTDLIEALKRYKLFDAAVLEEQHFFRRSKYRPAKARKEDV